MNIFRRLFSFNLSFGVPRLGYVTTRPGRQRHYTTAARQGASRVDSPRARLSSLVSARGARQAAAGAHATTTLDSRATRQPHSEVRTSPRRHLIVKRQAQRPCNGTAESHMRDVTFTLRYYQNQPLARGLHSLKKRTVSLQSKNILRGVRYAATLPSKK